MTAPRPLAGDGRPSLIGLGTGELAPLMAELGLDERRAGVRARQLAHWLYCRGADDIALMTTLPAELRDRLARRYSVARPEIVTEQRSVDGTRKWLLRFADGQEVETVNIPEEDRGAVCVSSQVGCTLTCSFCHTGTQPLVRNLGARRDRRPVHGGARRLRRMADADRDHAHAHQHRHDGHGRAALQFRQRRDGAQDRHGRAGHRSARAGASRSRPRASCR